MKKNNKRAGFTLVELLIVSVILSVVSLAIFTSFSNGIRIWKRVNAPIGDEDLVLFRERIGAELRGMLALKDIGFQGSESSIEFPLIVNSRRMGKRTVGKVAYSFNTEAGAVTRAVTDYSGMFTVSPPDPAAVLKNVRDARFSFYRFDAEARRFEWVDTWGSDEMPLAVRIELRMKGTDEEPVVCTFFVPVSRKKS